MTRWTIAVLVGLLASPALAQSAKTARGTVTTVSAQSLTVKVRDQNMTFTVDKSTQAIVDGGSHRTAAAQKGGAAGPKLTELIKVGQVVEVSYHDMGSTLHAATVRVTSKAK